MAIAGRRMFFSCSNTLPDETPKHAPGLGLVNLRRRLELLLGQDFQLKAERSDGLWRATLEMDLVPC